MQKYARNMHSYAVGKKKYVKICKYMQIYVKTWTQYA